MADYFDVPRVAVGEWSLHPDRRSGSLTPINGAQRDHTSPPILRLMTGVVPIPIVPFCQQVSVSKHRPRTGRPWRAMVNEHMGTSVSFKAGSYETRSHTGRDDRAQPEPILDSEGSR
jgi:hypothetical protein